MAKVSVDIPNAAIDEATKKHIAALEKRNKNLEKHVDQLKRSVVELEQKGAAYDSFREYVKDHFDLVDHEDCF